MSFTSNRVRPAKGRKKKRDLFTAKDAAEGAFCSPTSSASSLNSNMSESELPSRRQSHTSSGRRMSGPGTAPPGRRMSGGSGRRMSGGVASPAGRRASTASATARPGRRRSTSSASPGRVPRTSASPGRRTPKPAATSPRRMPKGNRPSSPPEPPKPAAPPPSQLPSRLARFSLSCGVPGCDPATCLHI